jgi:hypothetical protein
MNRLYIVAVLAVVFCTTGCSQTAKRNDIADISTTHQTYQGANIYDPESRFSIQYPNDWKLTDSRSGKALEFHDWSENTDACLITLGGGGSGVSEGDPDVMSKTVQKKYNGHIATEVIWTKGNRILAKVTTFSDATTDYLFQLYTTDGADVEKCANDYENILSTFSIVK